jgi:hypothetical protein
MILRYDISERRENWYKMNTPYAPYRYEGTMRENSILFINENLLFICGDLIGRNQVSPATFTFDFASSTLIRNADTQRPLTRRTLCLCSANIVAFGGDRGEDYASWMSSQCDMYSIANNEWIQLPNSPMPIECGATAAVGQKVYIATTSHQLMSFSPVTMTFEVITSFSLSSSAEKSLRVWDGSLLILFDRSVLTMNGDESGYTQKRLQQPWQGQVESYDDVAFFNGLFYNIATDQKIHVYDPSKLWASRGPLKSHGKLEESNKTAATSRGD